MKLLENQILLGFIPQRVNFSTDSLIFSEWQLLDFFLHIFPRRADHILEVFQTGIHENRATVFLDVLGLENRGIATLNKK